MSVDSALRAKLVASIPRLRAFAHSLVQNSEEADNLVHETLVRAWGQMHAVSPGNNFEAWLIAILRKGFYSGSRTNKREPDGNYARQVADTCERDSDPEIKSLQAALKRLCPEQREAILLVVPQGFSYEEAARICEVSLATIRSRVDLARQKLSQILSPEPWETFGADRATRARLHPQLCAV